MITTASRRRSARRPAPTVALDLRWSHLGARYRVTVWPDVSFQRQSGTRWRAVEPTEDVLASAAVTVSSAAWTRYLEFMPAAERAWLERYKYGRFAALLILARCPALLEDLAETPALAAFVAAHAPLRGAVGSRWTELAAVHERAGVFGLLEWLGLPAARETLAILRNLLDPDVPQRLLQPLRSSLWNPAATALLRQSPGLSDRQLAHFCHALAA